MFVAQGIVTATGGKTSHSAVVARGWGKCCIVGCEQLDSDYATKTASANGRKIRQGDWMTLDGNEGAVYEGEVKLSTPKLPDSFSILMDWADGVRRLGVRTNADTPHDARKERGPAVGDPGDDRRGFARGEAQGAGEASAIPAAGFHRHFYGDGWIPRYDPLVGSTAARICAA